MPAHTNTVSVLLDRVSFAWPDGSLALSEISGAFGAGRTGLVGRNGSGKSTLLRLIAGELEPSAGHVTATADVAYLPQQLTLDVARPVAEVLGIADQLAALRAIEAGDVDPRHFDAIGDGWDIEARAHAALAEAGTRTRHARPPRGRAVRRRGRAHRDRRHPAARGSHRPSRRADEQPRPRRTRAARRHRAGWRGALIVVSHDLALLELMDDTAELYENELSVFGGPYSLWRERLDTEQDAARQAERSAAQLLRREKRDRMEAEVKIARRKAMGRKAQLEKRVPPIVAGGLKRAAEVSAGKMRTDMRDRESTAREALNAAERRVRDDDAIRIDLPDPDVPAGRRIAAIGDGERSWIIQGPERVALVGANGVGKTTLLEALISGSPRRSSGWIAARPGEADRRHAHSARTRRHSPWVRRRPSPSPTGSGTCLSGSTGWMTRRASSRTCGGRHRR